MGTGGLNKCFQARLIKFLIQERWPMRPGQSGSFLFHIFPGVAVSTYEYFKKMEVTGFDCFKLEQILNIKKKRRSQRPQELSVSSSAGMSCGCG